jgi:hypothetical protein
MVYFMAIWYILGSFGNFSPFWYVVPWKIWQPCLKLENEKQTPKIICLHELLQKIAMGRGMDPGSVSFICSSTRVGS